MNIPYSNSDAAKTIAILIDPDSNMDHMIRAGMVDYPSGEYAQDCADLCNISTFIIGHQIVDMCEPGQLFVHEGVFGMIGNHTWLEIEDVIIDATIQQFVPEAEKLCIIEAGWNQYHSVRKYTFEEWLEQSLNIY